MSFQHTRDGIALTTRCTLCGMTTRSLSEATIYRVQRSHGWQECQRVRVEAARALAEPEVEDNVDCCRNDHEYTPENTRVDAFGRRHCQTCAQANTARHSEARRWARAARHGQEKEAS